MQGQSSRVARSPIRNSLHTNTSKATPSRFGKFGVESILNDMGPEVPSGGLDISQDDEMVPWLSYPIDDSLGQDYVSDLLPEISGVTGNGISDIVSNNTCNNRDENRAQGRDVGNGSLSMKIERQSIRPPTNNGSNYLNFSHFSRAANLVKANADGNPASGSSGVGRMEIREKSVVNAVKSTLERFNSTPKDIKFHAGLPKVNSRELVAVNTPKGGIPQERTPKVATPPERTENLCLEASIKNDNSRKGVPDGERIVEPMVASSSVGSGNSGDRVSCEQTHNSKRKFCDVDESDYRSDVSHLDVMRESISFFFLD